MKKNLLVLFFLISLIINSQNKELIKETFFKQSVGEIEKIAIENAYKGGSFVLINVYFKSDINGKIFDIGIDDKSKIFESEMSRIINQIPKLNPEEYQSKGQEMKYGLKIQIKLPTNKKRKRRIKKGRKEKIEYKGFYIKEYFPIKRLAIKQEDVSNFFKIEKHPVTENCKDISTESEIGRCIVKEMQRHVAMKFDVDLAQDIGLPPGKQRISITFVISKKGEIVNIEAQASHKLLIEEGIRVINSFPNFYKPGTINGEPVFVKYTMPISFVVVD